MKIEKYNSHAKVFAFKGYDARKLKGVLVTDKSCANALKKISDKTELDVYQPNIASKSIKKELFQLANENKFLWAQDYLTFINDKAKAVLFDNSRDFLKRVLRATSDGIKKDFNYLPVKAEPHLRGGNFFLCTNKGKKELLIVENKNIYSDEILKAIFGVENIVKIPKTDYHLDLFIRPLDNGNILVSDINKTKEGLQKGYEKIKKYYEENTNLTENEKEELESVINNINIAIKKLDITLKFDKYKPQENVEKVVETLKKAGYNPIRVPAAYHYLDGVKTKEKEQELWNKFENNSQLLIDWSKNQSENIQEDVNNLIALETFKHKNNPYFAVDFESFYVNNFINAIVNKKQNGELAYITNAPILDTELGITKEVEQKTGFSTKNMFIKSVEPYIKKENIYFVDEKLTQKLFKKMGGIHCAAAEMPDI